VGGIMIAHTVMQSMAGQSMTLTFQSVEWNVPVAKGFFDPPAQVKALLNPPKAEAPKI